MPENEFSRALDAFTKKVKFETHEVFVRSAQLAHQSIVDGSPVTSAPGQPVDTGNLKNSFVLTINPTVATIETNVEYAPIIEHNLRGATVRSTRGGFHSVKLTVNAFDKLVAQAVREVVK